jgi:hypothetical protein
LHGHVDRTVPGEEDKGQLWTAATHLGAQLEAVHSWHAHVADEEVAAF